MLCVAAVTRRKGHDVLLAALATRGSAVAVRLRGPLDFEPVFVEQLRPGGSSRDR